MEKFTVFHYSPALAEIVEDKPIEAVQVGHDVPKEGEKTAVFNLVEKASVDYILQGNIHLQLSGKIATLTKPEGFTGH